MWKRVKRPKQIILTLVCHSGVILEWVPNYVSTAYLSSWVLLVTWLAHNAKNLHSYVSVFFISFCPCTNQYIMFMVSRYHAGARRHILIPILYQSCEVPTFMEQLYYLDYPRYKDNQQRCQKYFWKRLYDTLAYSSSWEKDINFST